MSVFHGSVYSKLMNMRTGLSIAFPNVLKEEFMPYKAIYMLHGKSDDHNCWAEQTMLPVYVNEYNVIFIMPEVQKSWYEDMVYGLCYYRYITEELPALCKKLLPISDKREDTAIMGLSMGGYGALKCALRKPEQYYLCGAFSSRCNIRSKLINEESQDYNEFKAILGTNFENVDSADLYDIAYDSSKKSVKPKIFMTCGTEDALYQENLKFKERLESLNFELYYESWPGKHDWYFWNTSLKKILEYYYS